MDKIRVLIKDIYKLDSENFAGILQNDARFETLSDSASTNKEPKDAKNVPDVVLLNVNNAVTQGLDDVIEMRKKMPATQIVGISYSASPLYAKRLFQQGVLGFVTMNSSREELIKAIFEAAAGKRYICDEVMELLTGQFVFEEKKSQVANAISVRELEIIAFIREGLSSRQISDRLLISPRTVEVHRRNIYKKLQLKNVVSLINYFNSSVAFC